MKLHHVLTYINAVVNVAILTTVIIVVYSEHLPIKFIYTALCDDSGNNCHENFDVIHIAAQLGRLDFATIGITIFGVCVGVGAIFTFLFIKERSEIIAKETAEKLIDKWLNEVAPKINTQMATKSQDLGITDSFRDQDSEAIVNSFSEDNDGK